MYVKKIIVLVLLQILFSICAKMNNLMVSLRIPSLLALSMSKQNQSVFCHLRLLPQIILKQMIETSKYISDYILGLQQEQEQSMMKIFQPKQEQCQQFEELAFATQSASVPTPVSVTPTTPVTTPFRFLRNNHYHQTRRFHPTKL